MIYVGFIVILLVGLFCTWYGQDLLRTYIEFPDEGLFEWSVALVMFFGGLALLYWAYIDAPFPIEVHINFENNFSRSHHG